MPTAPPPRCTCLHPARIYPTPTEHAATCPLNRLAPPVRDVADLAPEYERVLSGSYSVRGLKCDVPDHAV